MGRRGIVSALGAALLACGCGPDAALDGLADGGVVRATGVSSGDVLTTRDGGRLHLAGVAAPAPGEPYAEEARVALWAAAGGRDLRLYRGGAAGGPAHLRDPRRRWLQLALLEAGAVRVRTTQEDRAMAREMLRAEAQAREAARGLWALPAYRVKLAREVVAERASGFLVVEGRVARAEQAGGRLFLEFGREWRGCFSSETPLASLGAFDAAGIDLAGLEGRLVRIRGEVSQTGYGPRLRLDHPEQLERLREAPIKAASTVSDARIPGMRASGRGGDVHDQGRPRP